MSWLEQELKQLEEAHLDELRAIHLDGLKPSVTDRDAELNDFYQMYKEEIASGQPPFRRLFAYRVREIERLEREARWEKLHPGEGDITQEMISKAKSYPITDLIPPVGRSLTALCIFHDDKHPSMTLKNNFAHCFVCAKSWDSIDIVMHKERLSFPEAVRKLCK